MYDNEKLFLIDSNFLMTSFQISTRKSALSYQEPSMDTPIFFSIYTFHSTAYKNFICCTYSIAQLSIQLYNVCSLYFVFQIRKKNQAGKKNFLLISWKYRKIFSASVFRSHWKGYIIHFFFSRFSLRGRETQKKITFFHSRLLRLYIFVCVPFSITFQWLT